MSNVNLSTCAMLAVFTSHQWRARKTDRKVSREVAANHGTEESVGRYSKCLLPMEAPSYEAIGTAYSAAYTAHTTNTLPWLDGGTRILPVTNFDPYCELMRSHKETCEEVVRAFLVDYPQLRDNARRFLNGMYNPMDYPDPSRMPKLFGIETRMLPMPDAADFRVSLSADVIASLSANVQASMVTAQRDAMADVNERLLKALAAMSERLSKPEAIYRDTLFTNLQELCDLAPRLNLTGDPLLTARCQEIKAQVLSCEPETARRNPAERARVAAEVNRIADLMR